MQVHCPTCGEALVGDDLNVATDTAVCQLCDEAFALSSLVHGHASAAVDLNDPPKGAWYREDFNEFSVGATTRHPIAFFLVPFMCIWSGGSLGGIYGTQIIQGEFDLFTSLFGIPFLLGTLLFGSIALMSVCGQVVVHVRDDRGVVFTGVGPLGWRRRFEAHEIKAVRVEPYAKGDQHMLTIVLDGPHKLRFASGLSETRRDFMAAVLQLKLTKGKKPRRGA